MFDSEKGRMWFPIFLILALTGLYLVSNSKMLKEMVSKKADEVLPKEEILKESGNMKITSSAFENNGFIPEKFTCRDDNVNPPLEFSGVPTGTQSLVLIVDDPDAPIGTWDHWIVFNIDPSITSVNENSVPNGGILGTNDFGKGEYSGPCPPTGKHRYFFRLYALDKVLDLSAGANRDLVEKVMKNSVLDSAELIGVFGK